MYVKCNENVIGEGWNHSYLLNKCNFLNIYLHVITNLIAFPSDVMGPKFVVLTSTV